MLDAAAKNVPQNPKNATKSDIKVMELRMQQRDTIVKSPELVTLESMGRSAFDEAQWYAGVPDGIARESKIKFYAVAARFFDALSKNDQLNEVEYRKLQASAASKVIEMEDNIPRVVNHYEDFLRLWSQLNSLAPPANQLEMAQQVQGIRKRLQKALENDPRLRAALESDPKRKGYLKNLQADEKKWDDRILELKKKLNSPVSAVPAKTK